MKTTWYEGEDGQWYWRTQAANNEVVATGAEGYEHVDDAMSGWYVSQGGTVAVLGGQHSRYGGPDMLRLQQHTNADQTEIEKYTLEWEPVKNG